jgi:hypothetical protein
MAQWNKNTQDYLNQERTLHEVFMCADRYGNIGNCGVTTGSGSGGHDAFGRVRYSEPFTLADYSHQYGEESDMLIKTVGAASTLVYNTNKASVSLVVGTGATDQVIHQSRMYHHYMPGKSQFALMSFNFQDVRENTSKRVGYYSDRNGIFLQQEGAGTVSIVKRSFTTGIASDTVVNQVNWSLDPMDGTGISSISLDFTKTQLFATDFQWLGVGKIRCGIVVGGELIYFHEFNHSNIEENVYWSFPSLPVRCEVLNTGTAVGITSMQQICSTVLSEGGYKESGFEYAYGNGAVTVTGSNSAPNNIKCLMAIRCTNTYNGYPNRTNVRITDLELLSSSATCKWTLYRLPGNANITGGTWSSLGPESAVEYNPSVGTAFTLTGGYAKSTGWIAANNPSGKQSSGLIGLDPTSSRASYIAQNIDSNDSNIFAVIVENLTTNADTEVYCALQWRETR